MIQAGDWIYEASELKCDINSVCVVGTPICSL